MHTMRRLLLVAGLFPLLWQLVRALHRPRHKKLYVKIKDDGSCTIGTCQHCVVDEKERPARASDAQGERDLDFPRDQLIGRLAEFGLSVSIEAEYVCP